jgi:hypothetical protein
MNAKNSRFMTDFNSSNKVFAHAIFIDNSDFSKDTIYTIIMIKYNI